MLIFDRSSNGIVSNISNRGIQDDLSDSRYHKRTLLRNGDGIDNRRSAGPDKHFPDVYSNGGFVLVSFAVPEELPACSLSKEGMGQALPSSSCRFDKIVLLSSVAASTRPR